MAKKPKRQPRNQQHFVGLMVGCSAEFYKDAKRNLADRHGVYLKYHWPAAAGLGRKAVAQLPRDADFVLCMADNLISLSERTEVYMHARRQGFFAFDSTKRSIADIVSRLETKEFTSDSKPIDLLELEPAPVVEEAAPESQPEPATTIPETPEPEQTEEPQDESKKPEPSHDRILSVAELKKLKRPELVQLTKRVGAQLRQLRIEKTGLPAAQIAKRIGLSKTDLPGIEMGTRAAHPDIFLALERVYGVPDYSIQRTATRIYVAMEGKVKIPPRKEEPAPEIEPGRAAVPASLPSSSIVPLAAQTPPTESEAEREYRKWVLNGGLARTGSGPPATNGGPPTVVEPAHPASWTRPAEPAPERKPVEYAAWIAFQGELYALRGRMAAVGVESVFISTHDLEIKNKR